MQNFSQSKNKFGYIYIVTLGGMAEKSALTGSFLSHKLNEYEALKMEFNYFLTYSSVREKRV